MMLFWKTSFLFIRYFYDFGRVASGPYFYQFFFMCGDENKRSSSFVEKQPTALQSA